VEAKRRSRFTLSQKKRNDSPPIESKDNTTAHADASRRLMQAAASEDNHNMGNKTSSVFITTLALNTP
jgi:hypothetical protein